MARKEGSTEEEKQEAAPKVQKDTKNGVTRPKEGTQTGRVWQIADEVSQEKGEPAGRKEVIEKFSAEGGNHSTGATQYGRWRKYHGLAADTGGKPGRPKKQADEGTEGNDAGAAAAPVTPPTGEAPAEEAPETAEEQEV